MLALVMVVSFASLLFMTASATAEVFFATDVLGAGQLGYGALMTAWTVGMVIGATVVARRVPASAIVPAALGFVALQGLGIALPTVWLVFGFGAGAFLVGGIAHATKNVLVRTLIHERVPDALRGRAFAAYSGLRNSAELRRARRRRRARRDARRPRDAVRRRRWSDRRRPRRPRDLADPDATPRVGRRARGSAAGRVAAGRFGNLAGRAQPCVASADREGMNLPGGQLAAPAAAVDKELEQVLLGLADGSYVLSTPDGAIAECGIGVVGLLGVPAEELAGRPTVDVLVAGADEAARNEFDWLLRAPSIDPVAPRAFPARTASGAVRSLRFVVVSVPLALGWEFTSLLTELRTRDAGTWQPEELRLRHGHALEAIEGVVRSGRQPDPNARLAGILIVVRDVDAPPLTREDVDRRMNEQREAAREAAAEAARLADEAAGRARRPTTTWRMGRPASRTSSSARASCASASRRPSSPPRPPTRSASRRSPRLPPRRPSVPRRCRRVPPPSPSPSRRARKRCRRYAPPSRPPRSPACRRSPACAPPNLRPRPRARRLPARRPRPSGCGPSCRRSARPCTRSASPTARAPRPRSSHCTPPTRRRTARQRRCAPSCKAAHEEARAAGARGECALARGEVAAVRAELGSATTRSAVHSASSTPPAPSLPPASRSYSATTATWPPRATS